MFGTLKQSIFSLLERIPIIRDFVPKRSKEQTVITSKTRAELETLHKNSSRKDLKTNEGNFVLDVSDQSKAQISTRDLIKSILENYNSEILDTVPNLKNEIASHIERNGSNPKAQINFREEIIGNKVSKALDSLISNYQTRFPLIQQRTAGNIDPEEYVDLMKQFINKTIKFILEINSQILYKTATLDQHVQDHNLAEAFEIARNISKEIAYKAFVTLRESFQQLPNSSFEGQQNTIHIIDYIRSRLEHDIKTLYVGSQFGIHSSELFQTFKNEVQKPILQDQMSTPISTYNSLSLIRSFQEATHGSILVNPQDPNNNKNTIADLDKEVKEKIIRLLIQTIIKEYKIRHDEIDDRKQGNFIESIRNTKKDLADCLIKIDHQESKTAKTAIKAYQNPLWTSLKLVNQSAEIQTLYSNLCSTHSLLGTTNDEVIMGHHHQGRSILNEIEIQANNPRIALERIIHEVSLLAVMDTASQFWKQPRHTPVLESSENFKTIPWLKPLYEAKCKEYASWLETEQVTKLPTRRLAKELARLGSELHSISSDSNPVFSFDDFCKRYKIEDLGSSMLKRMSNYNYFGVTALQFEIFSKLLANIKPGEQEGLTNDEVKNIQDLTEFLLEQTKLIDKDGKQIIAPQDQDTLCKERHERMQELIANRGTLVVDIPLIVKFLLTSLNLKNGASEVSQRKSLEQKNALLAVFLFNFLLKYLPEKSNNIDSLLKRQEVFTTLVDNFGQLLEHLPVLKDEILKQSLGFNEEGNGPHPTELGVIPSLCKDVERLLSEYPQRAKLFQEIEEKRKILEEEYVQTHDGHIAREIQQLRIHAKQAKPITLHDLLSIHDQLSDCIQRNPTNVDKIQTLLKNVKHSNGLLLKDLSNYVEALIEAEPTTIINFIKTSANQELQTYTKKLLLTRASKLAQELIISHTDPKNGAIKINDDDEAAIKKYTKILNLIRYMAFMVNHYGANKVSINSNAVDEQDQSLRTEIIQRINTVSELMKKNVILLINDNRINEEVFPGQLEAKRTLAELLQEFGIRSGLDHKIEWTSPKKAEELLKDSIYREQRIELLRDNKHEKRISYNNLAPYDMAG